MQRRRGEELETALLSAAWKELEERGYEALTIEGVAERAKTSRAVVYRRWATKGELVTAAIRWAWRQERPDIPDTGSIRGDLMEMLRRANTSRAPLVTGFLIQIGAFYRDTGKSISELRSEILGEITPTQQLIFDRAIARGEVDPARSTPRLRQLTWDLYRHELIMTMKPVPERVIEEIVDDIVLPLIGIAGTSSPLSEDASPAATH